MGLIAQGCSVPSLYTFLLNLALVSKLGSGLSSWSFPEFAQFYTVRYRTALHVCLQNIVPGGSSNAAHCLPPTTVLYILASGNA